jgi:hypothetical protein
MAFWGRTVWSGGNPEDAQNVSGPKSEVRDQRVKSQRSDVGGRRALKNNFTNQPFDDSTI